MRTDVAGEHRAAVDPDAHGDREVGFYDAPRRREHPLLLVPADRGRAGREQELAAVRVDVGCEECDVVRCAGLRDGGDERVERDGSLVGALVGEKRVEAAEVHECNRHDPMLGRTAPCQHVLVHGERDELPQVDVSHDIVQLPRGVGRPVG